MIVFHTGIHKYGEIGERFTQIASYEVLKEGDKREATITEKKKRNSS